MNISTTINPEPESSSLFIRLSRSIIVMALILVIWFGAMLTLTRFTNIAPAVLVLVSNQNILNYLPKNVQILRASEHVIVLTNNQANNVKDLYSALKITYINVSYQPSLQFIVMINIK